jgi:hypothetical protein
MEAELTTLDTSMVEADWLRRLLNDLPVVEKPVPGILMNCDNQTMIAKVSSSKDNVTPWFLLLDFSFAGLDSRLFLVLLNFLSDLGYMKMVI